VGRAASISKRMALPGARTGAAIKANIGACPSPSWRRGVSWRRVDDWRRHLVAGQSGWRRSEHDRFLRDIAKSASPRCATPGMDAFLQNDFRALRDALHDGRLAARPGAHRDGRSRHRQFRACRSDKGDGCAKPKIEAKTKTPNHFADPVVRRQGHAFQRNGQTRSTLAWWGSSLAEIRSANPGWSHEIFVARHVGPLGPKAGSMRKLSLEVIAPSGNASSGMTRVA
jgi:hypothetical protein